MSFGQFTTGNSVSITTTLNQQNSSLPAGSFTDHFTCVVPNGKISPAKVVVNTVSSTELKVVIYLYVTEQLSVAVASHKVPA